MTITQTQFPGLLILQPKVFEDQRGYFFESYNKLKLQEAGINISFVQDNQARSHYGTVRGLHFQKGAFAQTKLVQALSGSIVDVVLDLRIGSPTFGKTFSIELSGDNHTQLLVPKGFAHGYSVITGTAEVFYKCDEFYNPSSEGGVFYNDPSLKIDWKVPADKQLISPKDQHYPSLKDLDNHFHF